MSNIRRREFLTETFDDQPRGVACVPKSMPSTSRTRARRHERRDNMSELSRRGFIGSAAAAASLV
jgi:hypothetical protein